MKLQTSAPKHEVVRVQQELTQESLVIVSHEPTTPGTNYVVIVLCHPSGE